MKVKKRNNEQHPVQHEDRNADTQHTAGDQLFDNNHCSPTRTTPSNAARISKYSILPFTMLQQLLMNFQIEQGMRKIQIWN